MKRIYSINIKIVIICVIKVIYLGIYINISIMIKLWIIIYKFITFIYFQFIKNTFFLFGWKIKSISFFNWNIYISRWTLRKIKIRHCTIFIDTSYVFIFYKLRMLIIISDFSIHCYWWEIFIIKYNFGVISCEIIIIITIIL